MQQIYLTGPHAISVASKLFRGLNIHPAGFTAQPFSVNGRPAGEALHLLTQPKQPYLNDIPFRISLTDAGEAALIPEVLNRVAAPALRQVTGIGVPLLLGLLDVEMLGCADFLSAVKCCLHGGSLCVSVVSQDAQALLIHATPPETQLWLDSADEEHALTAALDEAMNRLRFGA